MFFFAYDVDEFYFVFHYLARASGNPQYDDGDVQMEVFDSLVFDDVPPNPYLESLDQENTGSAFTLAVRELRNYYQRWANPAEKRVGRWRNSLPETLAPNFSRALSESMKVLWRSTCIANTIQFRVMGSDGATIHFTEISLVPKCSCRNLATAKDVCEHTIFVLMNVLGVPRRSPFLFQRILVDEEISFILRRANLVDARIGNSVGSALVALDPVTPAPGQHSQTPPCMICFRVVNSGSPTATCGHQECGGRAHTECAELLKGADLPALLCPKCCVGWKN